MGIFKLFKKKKEKKHNDSVEQKKSSIYSVECESCKLEIEQWDKRKTFSNKKYHIKCFRQLKRKAVKMAVGN